MIKAIPVELPVIRQGGYNIVYADPAWQYNDKLGNDPAWGGITYETMDVKQICNLPVKEIVAPNAVLFIWIVSPMIKEGIQVLESWGFNYKTVAFVWVKTRQIDTKQSSFLPTDSFDDLCGMGRWTRSATEICLLGVRGKISRIDNNVRQIIYAPRTKHSKKPDETRERIVKLMGDLPRVELFARQKANGWDVWGNEVESDISLAV